MQKHLMQKSCVVALVGYLMEVRMQAIKSICQEIFIGTSKDTSASRVLLLILRLCCGFLGTRDRLYKVEGNEHTANRQLERQRDRQVYI